MLMHESSQGRMLLNNTTLLQVPQINVNDNIETYNSSVRLSLRREQENQTTHSPKLKMKRKFMRKKRPQRKTLDQIMTLNKSSGIEIGDFADDSSPD